MRKASKVVSYRRWSKRPPRASAKRSNATFIWTGTLVAAVAFAGTLATSVIGMVAAGAWSDARGPRGALYAADAVAAEGALAAHLERFGVRLIRTEMRHVFHITWKIFL